MESLVIRREWRSSIGKQRKRYLKLAAEQRVIKSCIGVSRYMERMGFLENEAAKRYSKLAAEKHVSSRDAFILLLCLFPSGIRITETRLSMKFARAMNNSPEKTRQPRKMNWELRNHMHPDPILKKKD